MTPKEIVTKHVSKIPGVRVRDVQRFVDAAFQEIAEFDFLILERRDLQKAPEVIAALYGNQAKRKINQ